MKASYSSTLSTSSGRLVSTSIWAAWSRSAITAATSSVDPCLEEEVSRIFMPPSITETTPAVWDPLLDESTEEALTAMMCITYGRQRW